MPTQRKITFADGSTMLGGLDYETSEACQWFLDGLAEGEGIAAGECEVSPELEAAWKAWETLCAQIWLGQIGTSMPHGFPIDAMHTAEGAGIGIDDGDRGYSGWPSRDALLGEMARGTFRYTPRADVREAFQAFQDAMFGCLPESGEV